MADNNSNTQSERLSEPARLSNVEFVKDLMEYSFHGALTQVFIIEAIRRYSEIIVAQPKPVDHGNSVISAITWHEIAEDIKTRMDAAYGGNQETSEG